MSSNGGLANQPRVNANFPVAQWNHSAGTLTVEWTLTAPVNLSSSGVLDVRLGGKIAGNLTRDGGLLRGDGTIEGDWTAFSGAHMDGNGALQFTGHVALDGQLQFDLSTVTFTGQSFDVDVFSAGSISSNFKTFDLTGLPSDYIAVGQAVTTGLTQAYVLHLSPVLTVPEPAGPLLCVAGLAMLELSRRCRRRKHSSLEVVAVEPALHRAQRHDAACDGNGQQDM